MSEQNLRALLAEAREMIVSQGIAWKGIAGRIDAALAEPVVECARCETLRELADTAAAEQGLAQRHMMEAQRKRDEARAEVRRTYKELSESIAREAEAYERGAEAMREAAAQVSNTAAVFSDGPKAYMAEWLTREIRALPVPEDKS